MNDLAESTFLSKQLSKIAETADCRESSHCRLRAGDILGGNVVIESLGRGRFSTVWAVMGPNNSTFAVKVYRSCFLDDKSYKNEVKILNKLFRFALAGGESPRNLIGYLGTFAHVDLNQDYLPRIYPCVAFKLGGDHIGRLMRHFRHEYDEALPIVTAKKIMKDILVGLNYLHNCGIIHGDIKPANILMNTKVDDITDLDNIVISIADFGSASTTDSLYSLRVGTFGYIAPEIILMQKYTQAIDIWAAFVVFYELITGEYLFDINNKYEIDYGEDVNEVIEQDNDDDADNDDAEASSADSSGSNDDEHQVLYNNLLLIEKLLGPAPPELWKEGREFYNARGKLKYNPDIKHISIGQLIDKTYELQDTTSAQVEEFLLQGLKYLPEQRCTAASALLHPWLN